MPGSARSHDPSGPRFKMGGKGKVLCSVHQTLLDSTKNLDTEFSANIADSAFALDDADEPSQAPDTSGDASDTLDDIILDDSAAHALAAIELDQLLNC